MRVSDGCDAVIRPDVRDSVMILPAGPVNIGGASLWELRALVNVVIPEGVERIGNYWFAGSDIESVTIPASVTEIGAEAFRCCKRLTRVSFAVGSILRSIGAECFWGSALTEIKLPRSLREIEHSAFTNCDKLKSVYLEEECDVYALCSKIPPAATIFPSQRTAVEGICVVGLRCLREVVAPDGIKRIGDHWFCRSGVEAVRIPASVTDIGDEAFC